MLLLVIGMLSMTAAVASAEDVDELERELEEATAGLDEAMERLSRARAELEAVEARLSAAEAELGRAQSAAATAEAEYEQAQLDMHEAIVMLEVAVREFQLAEAIRDRALERERVAIERLEERVIKAFKDGSTHPTLGLAQGIIQASDWHDVARTSQMVQRAIADDREIVSEMMDARAEADAARAEAERARLEAEELAVRAEVAEQRAAETLEEMEALVSQREAARANVAAERGRQQAIFRELEEDASVMQALANELQRRIAMLRSGGVCVGRVPAGGSVFSGNNLPPWGRSLVSRVSSSSEWIRPIAVASARNGIDAPVMASLVWSESGFRPTVVSHAGAIGLAQLMPGTAAGLGVDPWDPEENLDGGARYLAQQIDRFGSLELGLAAYNAGPGNVIRYGGIPPFAETQIYVVRVIERCQLITS